MKKLTYCYLALIFTFLSGCDSCKKQLAFPDVKVTSVNPTSGWRGDTVVVTGSGFSEGMRVALGKQDVESILATTSTEMTVIVPHGLADQSGPVTVTVAIRDISGGYHEKSITGPVFTYVRPTKVTITSISPDSAHVGDTITILGKNFLSDKLKNKVLFGGQQAKIINRPDGARLEVIVPQDTGTIPVIVSVLQDDNTTKSDTALFTYISDAAPTGGVMVSTLAGKGGVSGYADGTGSTARFYNPNGIAVDAQGNIYVSDMGNARIRKITPAGVVSTVAGNGTAGAVDGAAATAEFDAPRGVAVDASGNIYVVDGGNFRIRKITPAGIVSTLAGSTWGFADGTGAAAKFFGPTGIVVDASGNIYVSDFTLIRKITPAGVVSTLAGSSEGFADGTGTAAEFKNLGKIAIDAQGNIYAADNSNNRIRKITPAGVVSTVAGNGEYGISDGNAATAEFRDLNGIAVDASGNIYVGGSSTAIRKITPAGIVSTLAGGGADHYQNGYADGPASSALFESDILGLVVDAQGNIYVSDAGNNCIRKITFK